VKEGSKKESSRIGFWPPLLHFFQSIFFKTGRLGGPWIWR